MPVVLLEGLRARDLLLVPGLLSLSRAALALAFPFVVDTPHAALGVLAAAALSDVLDGYFARRLHQVTATGVVLDGITDKLFAFTVVITLALAGRISVPDVLLLSTRELGEIPLVVLHAFSHRLRRVRAEQRAANLAGKAATVAQFLAVAAVLLHAPEPRAWIAAAGAFGVWAAFGYWRRALGYRRGGTERGPGVSRG